MRMEWHKQKVFRGRDRYTRYKLHRYPDFKHSRYKRRVKNIFQIKYLRFRLFENKLHLWKIYEQFTSHTIYFFRLKFMIVHSCSILRNSDQTRCRISKQILIFKMSKDIVYIIFSFVFFFFFFLDMFRVS